MSYILVVDDMAVIREPIAAALRAKGYTAQCAADGKEALAHVGRSVPDLVLLDLSMPGIDGMAVLRALRINPATLDIPVILLTASGEKKHVVEAGRLGVRDYLLKTRFSFAELLARVQKNLSGSTTSLSGQATSASSPMPAAGILSVQTRPAGSADNAGFTPLTRQQAIERVETCAQTKTLPGVVAEVMALVNSARADVSDLASVLKRDPVLATRVLHLANSAAFASQKPRIATIDEAVRNIGVVGVRGMVISVGIFESFPPQGTNGSHITRCWQHSFAMASLMDRLAPAGGKIEPGIAHLAGLCYDLCDIVLRQHFAAEYQAMSDIVARTGRPTWQVRSAVFGMPYHELAALVLSKLDLPPVIITPIAEAFARSTTRDEGRSGAIAKALRIANVYAHGLMLAAGPDAPIVPIGTTEYRSTFGDAPVPDLNPTLLRSEVLTTVNLLAGVGSSEAAELCRPPIRPAGRKILYWRHPSYCDLDPLAALLGFAGDVDLVTEAPGSVAGYEILVVAGPRQENPAQQQLATLTRVPVGSVPTLYLSGLSPQQATAPAPITCRKLPITLGEAAVYFDRLNSEIATAA